MHLQLIYEHTIYSNDVTVYIKINRIESVWPIAFKVLTYKPLMDINSLLDNLTVNFLIDLSNVLQVSLHRIFWLISLIVSFAFLDIFAGSGIVEPRLGLIRMYYVWKARKYLPTIIDIVIIILLGSIFLRGFYLPEIQSERVFVHPYEEYQMKIPNNWVVNYEKPQYDVDINKLNIVDGTTFISPSGADFIFIGLTEGPSKAPSGFKDEDIFISNPLYSNTLSKETVSKFNRKVFTTIKTNSKNYVIIAESDKVLLRRYLNTLRFQ